VPPRLSRRTVLQSALTAGAVAAGLPLPARSAGIVVRDGLAAAAATVNPVLVARASAALAQQSSLIWSRDMIAIADFGPSSSTSRLHLVDLLAGRTTSFLVAHGIGSDPAKTGYLQNFSNEIGSRASSEGAYLIGETYSGVHGLSRRLTGLEPTNNNARDRAIVIHSAMYVGPTVIAERGKIGCSDGCFAISEQDAPYVLARLGEGRLLYAGKA